MTSVKTPEGRRLWAPVLALALAAFIFVTTEVLPIGLLPAIAADLGETEAFTGLLVTVYAWAVALLSLPLTACTARFERRRLLLCLFGIFIAGHIVSALSTNFVALMLGRLCIANAHAVFWSIASPIVVRITPPEAKAKGLAVVIVGSSLATVLGVPLGTIVGQHFGWRAAFALIGAAAACVGLVLWRLLPPLEARDTGSFKSVPALFHDKELALLYLQTMLAVTGHFIAYTYLAPLLLRKGGFTEGAVPVFLLLMGVSGIAGSLLAARLTTARTKLAFLAPLLVIGFCLLLLRVSVTRVETLAPLCVLWGGSMAVINLLFQSRVLELAAHAADIATSLYSGIFNVGIGGGAFIGSLIFNRLGLEATGYAGAVFFALTVAACLCCRRKDAKNGPPRV
ncbi:sugar transporter [Desulfovibrio legallii]|jgi:predicted MFS family arabinose efflux permease|uniref:MFS transporter, DHA1 family, purine ribonucleoside efflux pump/MFS transporter, DHA1 family, L-arabinose/isopropyl-beta-D-thiogalactopyranoside export protein n=1 Tax=Desulfovibrio legallii TaxID=571438 RepID=A0A1G7QPE2_9BACT|nr:sugar transporter [Desulfovibrio legallii]SDG00385.1 MFS transporter, DHA1 family, purine ribonucleoside efflux pump/MFS transporter, DHA1 family, L-arabinose/isopropyl-beta-D-thiogalactopyranoside export protein [Desulfovibrio legallii]